MGINIILLLITVLHFYTFPVTENMSLSLYNKKIYRRLIFDPIDSFAKEKKDEKILKEYVNSHSEYFYVTSSEAKYHLTKEEIIKIFIIL